MTDEIELHKKLKHQKDELSRRQWLLRLGETAALLGLSGTVSEAEASANAALGLLAPQLAALPTGLYEPSSDHLSHVLIADDRYHPIPPGSETDYARPREGPFQPQFFSAPEFEVISQLVKLILGKAPPFEPESASAQADNDQTCAEVAEWIDLVVFSEAGIREAARRLSPEHRALAVAYHGESPMKRLETGDIEKTCREGLRWLVEESQKRFSKALVQLDPSQQKELLTQVGNAPTGKGSEDTGTRFLAFLKRESIRGFYTSWLGLKELDYKGNSFYAECPGCEREGS